MLLSSQAWRHTLCLDHASRVSSTVRGLPNQPELRDMTATGKDDGRRWPHGGFAYFYDAENFPLDCIFPVH
eukprot:5263459-Pleurochrysis_carterae.AAC.1